jgi:hypothetical protein
VTGVSSLLKLGFGIKYSRHLEGVRVVAFDAASGRGGWSLNAEVELRISLIRSLDDGLVDQLVSLVSVSMTKLRQHSTTPALGKPDRGRAESRSPCSLPKFPIIPPCQKFFISKSRTRFLERTSPPPPGPAKR